MLIEEKEFKILSDKFFDDLIKAEYVKLSKQKSVVKFVLPILNNSNDYIEIFLSKIDSNIWMFSDFGEAFDNLLKDSINIKQFPYNKLFRDIANNYDIKFNPIDNSILKKIYLTGEIDDNLELFRSFFIDFVSAIHSVYNLVNSTNILDIISDNLKYNIEFKNKKNKVTSHHYIFQKLNIANERIIIQNLNITFVFGLREKKFNKIKEQIKHFVTKKIDEHMSNNRTSVNYLNSEIENYIKEEILKELDFTPDKLFFSKRTKNV